MSRKPEGDLKKGWTTGACATAAATAAYDALLSGEFKAVVTINLPQGQTPVFNVERPELFENTASCAIIKDAGDDPDVTHGAEICVTVKKLPSSKGVLFKAGLGVGTITKPGLPLDVGEPAINPKPREMIRHNLSLIAEKYNASLDVEITISVPTGEVLAEKTWNPRLGILGGISILGTTGIVIPYSCSAWIHSIHRGIDVVRATNLTHVAGSTGKLSEAAVQKKFNLSDVALLDMGDFVGGMLKYLRKNPVSRLTISGGFAKMVKLAQGNLDLHSSRSQVDFKKLAAVVDRCGGSPLQIEETISANTAKQVLDSCKNLPLSDVIAKQARETALATLSGDTQIDVMIIDRDGKVISHAGV